MLAPPKTLGGTTEQREEERWWGHHAGAWLGRALVLPWDFGLHPIDIEEPGPRRAKGVRERTTQLYKNKPSETNDQNLVLSNACRVGGSWHLAGPATGGSAPRFPCFSWQPEGRAACLLPVWTECRPWGGVDGEVIWSGSISNRVRTHPEAHEVNLREQSKFQKHR